MVAVAVLVRQDLHLNVLGLHQEFLNENIVVAKGLLCLAAHQFKSRLYLFGGIAAAHTTATAAGCCLENDGESEGNGLLQGIVSIFQRLGATGNNGNPGLNSDLLGTELIAHQRQNIAGWSNKFDPRLFTGLGKIRIFRKEAIAGMDGIHTAAFRQVNDRRDIQVGANGAFVLADEICLVRMGAELAIDVLVGIHGHRMKAQIVAGAEDTDRDFATVRGQHLIERFLYHNITSNNLLRAEAPLLPPKQFVVAQLLYRIPETM